MSNLIEFPLPDRPITESEIAELHSQAFRDLEGDVCDLERMGQIAQDPIVQCVAREDGYRELVSPKDFKKAGVEFLIQGLVARKSYAAKSRDVVIGMIKATMEGIKQIFVNEKHAKAVLAKYTRQTDPEILDQTHKFALDVFVKDPTVTPGSIQPIVQQSAQFNLIDAKLAGSTPIGAYYDNSYVDEIKRTGWLPDLWR